MIIAVLIVILSIWSLFGLIVLWNLNAEKVKRGWKLALTLGPIILILFFIIYAIYTAVEKAVDWLEKA